MEEKTTMIFDMKKLLFFCLAITPTAIFCQVATVDAPLPLLTPTDIVGDAAILSLLSIVTMAIAYFSKLIPGLGSIPDIKVRAGVSAAALVLGVAYFKGGFFGSDTFPFITNTLLLVLAAFGVGGSSGWLYDLLQKLIGSQFKSLK
jgi:hypothetical protein